MSGHRMRSPMMRLSWSRRLRRDENFSLLVSPLMRLRIASRKFAFGMRPSWISIPRRNAAPSKLCCSNICFSPFSIKYTREGAKEEVINGKTVFASEKNFVPHAYPMIQLIIAAFLLFLPSCPLSAPVRHSLESPATHQHYHGNDRWRLWAQHQLLISTLFLILIFACCLGLGAILLRNRQQLQTESHPEHPTSQDPVSSPPVQSPPHQERFPQQGIPVSPQHPAVVLSPQQQPLTPSNLPTAQISPSPGTHIAPSPGVRIEPSPSPMASPRQNMT
eukprot:Gregarina_sp_Poly_1__1235@NODE_12_length_23383_cov_104_521445_g10_i0_p6_GENE_NODE_12_length_23383_cov_104_521445_g10_i0NODE_12_length_23383_cov_104_521445_g10_i0_p6_ORF_typecomplete_len276_score35_70G_path_suppress/PF15991_5/0_092DUF4131/PF13567_6/0_12Shisa/PF13908_6/1_NODE_12_length_23383_cov_104_521445_g10_i01578616613